MQERSFRQRSNRIRNGYLTLLCPCFFNICWNKAFFSLYKRKQTGFPFPKRSGMAFLVETYWNEIGDSSPVL